MTNGYLILSVLALAALAFALARRRAVASVAGDTRKLHSLPRHHGQTAFLLAAVPGLVLMGAWLLLQPVVIDARVGGMIDAADIPAGSTPGLVMADVRRIGEGLDRLVAAGAVGEEALAALCADAGGLRARLAEAGVALGGDI
uniref:phosphate ABC transporter permease family protein n=1 Tax=Albidovulum sp. TaxID=1872424 RepID=UPI0039B8E6D2